MQLILTHADLTAALINDLRSKGMTAFEPGKASVTFAFKRGTKELECVLDTEPKAEAEAPVAAPKQASAVTPSATTSAPVAEAPASAPVAAAEEPAPVAPAEEPVTTTAEAPVAETAGSDDDNLFD